MYCEFSCLISCKTKTKHVNICCHFKTMLLYFEGKTIAELTLVTSGENQLFIISWKMTNLNNVFKSSLTLQDSEVVPIHLCVLVGHVKLVEETIKAKVDVNLKCPESGETPLHLAAFLNNKQVADTLIKNGANINVQCNKLQSPLHQAVKHGNEEMVQLLLSNAQWTPPGIRKITILGKNDLCVRMHLMLKIDAYLGENSPKLKQK